MLSISYFLRYRKLMLVTALALMALTTLYLLLLKSPIAVFANPGDIF